MSAMALTTSNLGSKINTFNGEYSSSGMMRSCKYLNLSLNEPHSPMGVTPDNGNHSSVSDPDLSWDKLTVNGVLTLSAIYKGSNI